MEYQEDESNDFVRVDNKDPSFLQWFLNNKNDVDTLKFLWRGYERDFRGIWKPTPDSLEKRIMNEKGIHWAIQLIESFLSKVFQSSNFDEENMNFEMRSAVRAVYFGIISQFRQFELSKVNSYVVAKQMISQIHAIMLSARGNGIRDFLTKTHQVSEVRNVNPDDNRGFLNGITSLFNRKQPGANMYQ